MPKLIEPKVYLIGETRLIENPVMDLDGKPIGFDEYLDYIGAPNWITDAKSDSEELAEIMGRLCYRSFAPGLNPNVTKVREGNEKYLEHVIGVNHGSILEHSSVNFLFQDVSRVYTHELVRHRPGTAISQESLRFVRLDKINFWLPTCIAKDEYAKAKFTEILELLEETQLDLANHFGLDNEGVNFDFKKEVTSAMRRIAPIGLATAIGWSCNMRSLRHIIEMRTNRHAEEEIRLVFNQVATICRERYPNFFADYNVEQVKGYGEWTTKSRKI